MIFKFWGEHNMVSATRYALAGLLIAASNPCWSQTDGPGVNDVKTIESDLSSRDLTVRPGDDFNRYASGHWLDTTVIPADKQSDGSKDKVYFDTQAALRTIVQADAADTNASGDTARIGRLYVSFMDEAAIDRRGATALAHDLATIRAAPDHAAIAALTGRALGGLGPLCSRSTFTRI
jgi:putative endopeptidase